MADERTLRIFFSNEKGELPAFIHGIDDFPHMKIVYLKGRLDAATSKDMDYFFKKAKKHPGELNKNVLLDFRKVDEFDSAAVAQLLKALAVLKKKNLRMALYNVPERMKSRLEILKVDTVFQVFESKTRTFEEIVRWSQEWD